MPPAGCPVLRLGLREQMNLQMPQVPRLWTVTAVPPAPVTVAREAQARPRGRGAGGRRVPERSRERFWWEHGD